MFDRYTEGARRVIFFARYEASQFGSVRIEMEHMLLGLLREDRNILDRFAPPKGLSVRDIQSEIERRVPHGEKVSTSIDLPLSNEAKRSLAYAAEEADAMGHRHIGPEHLLLGALREDHVASEILRGQGLDPERVRETVGRGLSPEPSRPRASAESLFEHVWIPDAETAVRVAEAILTSVAGRGEVERLRPFQAAANGHVWVVKSAPTAVGSSERLTAVIERSGRVLFAGKGP